MFVIFDLDGTLSDDRWRSQHINNTPRGDNDVWNEYWHGAAFDKPIRPICDLFRILYITSHVEIWTGRDGGQRSATVKWLEDNVGYSPDVRLRMRPHGSTIGDLELKAQWLKEVRSEGTKIDLVFDDRNKMVAWWRSQGIICCHVQEGDF